MGALLDEVRMIRALPDPAERRRIRVAAGITQHRMAEELGAHPVTFARWERGERAPRSPAKVRYAALLAELAAEMADPPPPVIGAA
jgi:transcriptional regulator with XRE-family HTH domain